MSLVASINSNKQWGGYSRARAQWVSEPCAGGELGNFFGWSRSVLALDATRWSRIGRCCGAPARSAATNAESMTYGQRSRVVAWPVVAALAKSVCDQGVGQARRLIANLRTRCRLALAAAWGSAASWAIGRGGFPLSRALACPQTPRARQGRDPKCFRAAPRSTGSRATDLKNREVHRSQMGSGVEIVARGAGSGANGAESSRINTGRGNLRDHPSLDAGRVVMLLAAESQVNGTAQKISAR